MLFNNFCACPTQLFYILVHKEKGCLLILGNNLLYEEKNLSITQLFAFASIAVSACPSHVTPNPPSSKSMLPPFLLQTEARKE